MSEICPPTPPELCPWVAADDLNCSPCDVDPEVIARAATIIAEYLSGHQFGLRNMRLRPQALLPTCYCRIGCGCGRATEAVISEHVWDIVSVKVDGVTLDDADWVLYGDNRLVRVDDGTFPCCQRLSRDPDTDYGTFEIDGTFGTPPDEMGILAVQQIACELVNTFDNPGACLLPQHVSSFTRQQLSVNFTDPTVAKGFAALPLVDLWLRALDADSMRRPGRAVDLSRMTAWRAPAEP